MISRQSPLAACAAAGASVGFIHGGDSPAATASRQRAYRASNSERASTRRACHVARNHSQHTNTICIMAWCTGVSAAMAKRSRVSHAAPRLGHVRPGAPRRTGDHAHWVEASGPGCGTCSACGRESRCDLSPLPLPLLSHRHAHGSRGRQPRWRARARARFAAASRHWSAPRVSRVRRDGVDLEHRPRGAARSAYSAGRGTPPAHLWFIPLVFARVRCTPHLDHTARPAAGTGSWRTTSTCVV